ncbi:Amino acid permease [Ceratobasidium theobromae]|uniref:Amino acid permease n=1 Tax=Ceratobasidium theobromae TaxID=1582974 RepID=A0A5N5QIU3_9AGAM|nr:Amino acid permease [Ceratobasidium theobromae]
MEISTPRTVFFIGIIGGGPLALWTSSLVLLVFTTITAAVLCEICSALPTSGSLYVWAAEAAGPKYGRFVAFITAWWVTAAWMTFPAAAAQFGATYILSIPSVYGRDFPGGISNDNVKWRAVIWIVAQILLLFGIGLSCIPPRRYPIIFRIAMATILFDMFLNITWFPARVHKTYGFRSSKETLLTTFNATGASTGWSWMLSFFALISSIAGFEASAHVAEETKNAKIVAARSVLAGGFSVALFQFIATILYLFCVPSMEVMATLNAPQPFVLVYSLALGRGGATFMAILSTLNYTLATVGIVMSASRLVFAIARDGALPFAKWVQKITPDKGPRNAVLLVYMYSATLLCTSLPSAVAFTSLMSIGCVPLVATYGLIGLLRLVVTPGGFKSTEYSLGYLARPFYFLTAVFGALMVSVLLSPLQFPVTGPNLNYAGVVFGAVTIFGVLTYWRIPENKWMRSDRIQEMFDAAD